MNERTLLIANRGEIARRVLRTARAEGWRVVALHTDLDAEALHVTEADAAVRVPSYLDIDAVVAAAVDSGATHVHPGYGFLSERSAFARALEAAGVVLVGPSADVMDAMGRKDQAREVAVAAGVPVVPSYDVDADPATFAYPVLVKAAAGGGGKGMRIVRSASEYDEAAAAARRESASAFGDDTLLVEKYVERGRHIEVQVIGDHHGTVVHLFERDCSTQRRHQKVLEEAPAPTLSDAQRSAITGAGVALAQQVGYTNAGTVEFLLDEATGEFYFLEMNTRLQVEHPVTEEVVRVRGERVDLVALQLAVACGEPLGFAQSEVSLDGHAIEARVYAEDPWAGFLPQAGRAKFVIWPHEQARVDHALPSDSVVSTSYDPMLGKVIARGSDREPARLALIEALEHTIILGLTTNVGFLRELAASDAFRDAAIDTAWLDRNEVPRPDADDARRLAALHDAFCAGNWAHEGPRPSGPFVADGWRLGRPPAPMFIDLDQPLWVDLAANTVSGHPVEPGDPRTVVSGDAHQVEVVHRGQRFVFERPDPFGDHSHDAGGGTLLAPMPGTVLDVRVSVGDPVSAGQVLGVLEAMKMELALKAPYDGVVAAVGAAAGDQVALGARLFEVEES